MILSREAMNDLQDELNEFDDDEGYQSESDGQAIARKVVSAAAIAELQRLTGNPMIDEGNYEERLEEWLKKKT